MRNAAQRWFRFHNVGPSPRGRLCHAMASDGTRVFVLGGRSKVARTDDLSHIHFFDTSMYAYFIILSGQPSKFRTQVISSTLNTSVVLSIPMRRPPNLRGSRPQVPPWSNHRARSPLHRKPTVVPVCKTLPPLYQVALLVNQDKPRRTMSAKLHQPSTMGSPQHLIPLLKETFQGWSSNGSCRYCLLHKLSGTSASHS